MANYPLKYLKFIQYKVDKNIINEFSELNYLSYLLNIDENEKVDTKINFYFYLEEEDIKIYLKNYFEEDKNSTNIYSNYYKSFLERDGKPTLFPTNKKLVSIYVYQLTLSMLFFKDIIYEYIYQTIKKEYNFFRHILDNGTNGCFFEVLVDYYIKSSR